MEAYRASQRRRLAREMHDDFGQLLATMKIDLSLLEQATAGNGLARRHVQRLQKLVETMMSSVRRVIAEQPPKILEEEGLAAAVYKLTEEFASRQPIRFVVDLALPAVPMAMPLQQTVYRILQESLNNVGRHAEAKVVHVRVALVDAQIRIHVGDDGKGLVAPDFHKPDSVGLAWMRDRVAAAGGSMHIASASGSGTSLDICLPYVRRGPA